MTQLHATVFPPTSRQSPKLDNRRGKGGDRRLRAIQFSGKVAGVHAIDLIGEDATFMPGVSTIEVRLAFTSRACPR